MAGKTPSFITGATAKIKAGNLTLAYAQDVSFNTTVTTIPIERMGAYEVVSNEPVAYFVDGNLSIIRYTKEASQMQDAAANGNSVEQMVNIAGNGGTMGDSLDPARMIASETFDLEIFQKTAGGGVESVAKLRDCRLTRNSGGLNKRGVLVDQFSFVAILKDNDADVQVGHSGDQDLQP